MEQGRIVNGQYVQGSLKFAVDADAHKTFDAVAALSNADKITLAKINGIPCEPFNKNALTTILKSVVQNAWFANRHNGVVPAEVVAGHQGRLALYVASMTVPTSTVDFLSKKTRASKSKPSLMYQINLAKYEAAYEADHDAWRGQRYLVIDTMLDYAKQPQEEGKGITVREIFENTKETRAVAAPSRNAVGQIVNALVAAGIVTLLNPQDVRAKATKKTTATPAPKPVATVPKKKH